MPSPLDFLRQYIPQPTKLTPEEQAEMDRRALADQADDPEWQKTLRSGFEGASDFVSGALWGDPLDPDASKANLSGQMLTAATPFAFNTGVKGLFSRVNKAAEALPKQVHPNRALSTIKNQASTEEMDWRGLTEFLGAKAKTNQPVQKQEVLSHLEQNPLKVEVKTLGGSGTLDEDDIINRAIEALPADAAPQEIQAYVDDLSRQGSTPPTKHSQYQLPGGENYRETLIKLDDPKHVDSRFDIVDEQGMVVDGGYASRREAEDSLASFMEDDPNFGGYFEVRPSKSSADQFHSSHWYDPNVLAHVRHNERTLPSNEPPPADLLSDWTPEEWALTNGPKGRFIEEIQSDWHQQGANVGYAQGDPKQLAMAQDVAEHDTTNAAKDLFRYIGIDEDSFGDSREVLAGVDNLIQGMPESLQTYPELQTKRDNLSRLLEQREAAYRAYERSLEGVPDAPFKDDEWMDLALKQQVLDLADRDDLSWLGISDAKTQIDRYGTERLRWAKDPVTNEQGWRVSFEPQVGGNALAGQGIGDMGEEALRRDLIKNHATHVDTFEELKELLGDTIKADKAWKRIQASPEVGEYLPRAEGHKMAYDEKLPAKLQKILKPFGGKVEKGQIPVAPHSGWGPVTPARMTPDMQQVEAWIAQLTPEIKKQIKEKGLSLLMLMALMGQPQLDNRPQDLP